jgi:7,8-dihydropterin-6-yl-methyl-4-(beta-D-ribofuranosyl)aminobenzene 5'-phosphate synthase
MKITVVIENSSGKSNLLTEHGLAFWIESGDKHILFDTGQNINHSLQHNAKYLNVPLDQTDHIVISHGHYDHTGGLVDILQMPCTEKRKIFIHPEAFKPKYKQTYKGTLKYLGMPVTKNDVTNRGFDLIDAIMPTKICSNIFTTGEIPHINDYEKVNPLFFKDKNLQSIDPLIDDQALYMLTNHGVAVLLGCAHAGVINTLTYIRKMTNKRIYAVIGGMHLANASMDRINKTIDALKDFNIQYIIPGHCTGLKASVIMKEYFKNRFLICKAGESYEFN